MRERERVDRERVRDRGGRERETVRETQGDPEGDTWRESDEDV